METHLDKVWKENPEIIRRFYERLPVYERLCSEVKYILEKRISSSNIEVGHINCRAKNLSSFCEKISRKKYISPFEDIKDLAGVRVVYLYASDKKLLESIVESEFEIVEKVDKIVAQDVEKFGYGALHYIIKLKEQHAGARYDDLRTACCELQIRTILQDAWAIVAHHLSYKHESDIPNELRRKLHALSGLFETADDQFERINLARAQYQEQVKNSISENKNLSLEADINLDNLLGYLSWKFPDREPSLQESAADLLEELQRFGYSNLKSVDDAVNLSWSDVLRDEEENPPADLDDEPTKYVGVGLIRTALLFTNEDYKKNRYGD